jgi:hypothetical protein
MHEDIKRYNDNQTDDDKTICYLLAQTIDNELIEAESKIWHGHPVWFIDGNPIVGYSMQKAGLRLMFWSGVDFEEENLNHKGKKFKDASIFYTNVEQINLIELTLWIKKSRDIQWDYKNIVKKKGLLEKLN